MSNGEIYPRWFELSDGVNNVSVTKYEALDYSQTYAYAGGSFVGRMMNGRAFKQNHWSKLITTLSGSGILPAGLSVLDFTGELVLRCGAPRTLTSLSNTISMPPYRVDEFNAPTSTKEYREDDVYVPEGLALVDDIWVRTPLLITTNVATLTVVPGAVMYKVLYFPEIVVFFEENPSESYQYSSDSSSSWSLTAVQK